MKIPVKSLAIAASICLLIAIALASFLIYELNARVQSLQGANRSLTSEVVTYKNSHGKLLTQVQAAEVRSKDIDKLLPDVAESIKKDFDIKMRNMRAYMQAEFSVRGSGNSEIRYIRDSTKTDSDTTAFEPFAMIIDDGYLSLMSEVYSDTNAPYEYTYADTIKYAFHMKGKFLQRKQLYATGMLSNKNARVLNSEAVLINEFKDRRWSVGPCLSWGVDQHLQTNFTVGFSVQYSLFKF